MVTHSRQRPFVKVPKERLVIDPDLVKDKRLLRLYGQLRSRKIKVALTRLPISTIVSGYYDRQADSNIHISNLRSEYVPVVERAIRGGSRPCLDVYWTPLAPGGGAYVCADDETALAAYSRLNVSLVPCKILKPQKVHALEASIWVEARGELIAIAKAVPPTLHKYFSLVGVTLPPFRELVRLLIVTCKQTRASIVTFHEDDGSGVHYHQMLHALLRRHERILDSIARMVALGRAEHASALTRVAYEAFLNFYVDWLSPEFFGPRLQMLSAVRVAQGRDEETPDDILAELTNFIELFENTSDKARVSPLGSFFHRSIYPPLSLVAHQSYAYLEYEASDFHDADPVDLPSHVEQLGRWLDVLTAALSARIRNEVGISMDLSSVTTSDEQQCEHVVGALADAHRP